MSKTKKENPAAVLGRLRWSKKSPEEIAAHIAIMIKARKKQAKKKRLADLAVGGKV